MCKCIKLILIVSENLKPALVPTVTPQAQTQDVTNIPSLMPEYKTQQQKTNIKVKQESDKNKTIIK